jgi:cell wall assembly regulator SMI1
MVGVRQAWHRIDAWLRENAPASYASLAVPADERELARVEDQLGLALDSQLRAHLACHNGVDQTSPARFTFPTTYAPLDIEGIARQHAMLRQILADQGGRITGWWWDPQWVPFALSVGADCLVVDHRPDPHPGQVGTFLHDDHTTFDAAPSLAHYLDAVASALEQETSIARRVPRIEDGALAWRPDRRPPDLHTLRQSR